MITFVHLFILEGRRCSFAKATEYDAVGSPDLSGFGIAREKTLFEKEVIRKNGNRIGVRDPDNVGTGSEAGSYLIFEFVD